MALTDAGLKATVDGLAAACGYLSLHSANPGTTGAAEIGGGTPAYARKVANWGPATAGVRNLSPAVVFDVPAATTISYFGMWTAATGGTYIGGGQLRDIADVPASEVFATQGFYELTNATLTATATV